ncbi:hypothetical protein BSKO_07854 [Bryopsis sp. KO-2023]|nr:hypothetical protein BSKO_07854 [Bryopsis sp. KO-2023]
MGTDGNRGGDDELKKVLMGSSKTSMNLALFKQRTEDVCKSLDAILTTLQFHQVQWGPMLDQFSVCNVKMARMREQLRPLLQHYAVHPTALTQENAEGMHLLLATKLLAEMEEEEVEMLEEMGVGGADAQLESHFVRISEQVDNLNGIVSHLTIKSEIPESGMLDSRGSVRMKVNENSRKIVRTVAKLREKKPAPGPMKRAGRPGGTGKGGKSQGSKSKPDSREILLNAMLTGEGLRDAHHGPLLSRVRTK